MPRRLSRREFLQVGGAAAGTFALAGLGLRGPIALAAPPRAITLGTWGGVWENAFKQVIGPMFKRETGVDLVYDIASSQERLVKIRAQRENQRMDIAMLTPEALVMGAQEDLLEPLDPTAVASLRDIDPRFKDPFKKNNRYVGTAFSWVANALLWRKDLVPFEIRSWKDLWRPELRGRISLQNMPTLGAAGFIIAASIVHGGTQYNVEPGWKALKALRPNIKFFFSLSSAALNQLASGEIWATSTIGGQGVPYLDRGVRITIPVEGTHYSMQGMGIAVNAPNRESANRFISFAMRPDVQRAWVEATYAAPTNKNTRLDIRTEMLLVENAATVKKLWNIDFLHMAQRMEEWTERWQREIA